MTAVAVNGNNMTEDSMPRSARREPVLREPLAAAEKERYVFADALRGVAALWVLLRHLFTSSVLYGPLHLAFPRPLQALCYDGVYGVHIFFVLSGFVIAHSLRNLVASPRSVGRFIVRRQLRLDPLYWTLIVVSLLELGVRHVMASHVAVKDAGFPGPLDILCNVFYLHNILDRTEICSTAWTLCIEVQFYLAFIACLAIGQFVSRLLSDQPLHKNLSKISVVLVALLGLASMILMNQSIHFPKTPRWSPWFTSYWYYFAAGAIACWAVQGRVAPWVYGVFACVFLFCAGYWHSGGMATGVAAASLLFLVGAAGHLTDWLTNPVLQYLGRISYSLYMVHLPVLGFVMRGGYKLTHENRPAAVVWFVVAAVLSIAVAHLTYLLVEKPSLKLSEKFKQKRSSPAPARTAPAETDVSGFADDATDKVVPALAV